jgi:hypothetical protein
MRCICVQAVFSQFAVEYKKTACDLIK